MSNTPTSQELSSMTFKQFFRSISILHFAMCTGAIMILSIMIFLLGIEKLNLDDINYTHAALAITGIFSLGFISRSITYSRYKSLNSSDSLSQKLIMYRSNKILTFASIEGPVLLCTILGYLFIESYFFIISVLGIIYLFSLKPSQNEIIEVLPVTSKENSYFNGNITLEAYERSL